MTNFCLDCCIRLKFQNCQISSALDLLMRPAGMVFQWAQFPVSRIHRTSFKSFKIHEFRDKRKLMPSRYVSVSSITGWWQLFTTNGVENSVSFHCLTLFAPDVKKYFYHVSSVFSGVLMFNIPITVLFSPNQG